MGAKSTDDEPWCTVCENPCEDTVSIAEKSINVDEFTWICYDPGTDSEVAFLHE